MDVEWLWLSLLGFSWFLFDCWWCLMNVCCNWLILIVLNWFWMIVVYTCWYLWIQTDFELILDGVWLMLKGCCIYFCLWRLYVLMLWLLILVSRCCLIGFGWFFDMLDRFKCILLFVSCLFFRWFWMTSCWLWWCWDVF